MKDDIGSLVKNIHDRIGKICNRRLASHGLTLSQAKALEFIRGRGGRRTTQKDVEAHLKVSHPTTVGILRRLEGKKLIRTELDGKDRRVKNVHLTSPDAGIFAGIERVRKDMERDLTGGLSAEESRDLLELLKKVYGGIRR